MYLYKALDPSKMEEAGEAQNVFAGKRRLYCRPVLAIQQDDKFQLLSFESLWLPALPASYSSDRLGGVPDIRMGSWQ
jgi:hypothetical protein